VVAGDDAREAINEVVDALQEGDSRDFRIKGVEIVGYVDIIAHKVVLGEPLK